MPSHVPIAVFGYSRPRQLQRTLTQLSSCVGFSDHPVHLFLDGAKGNGDEEGVKSVRDLAEGLDCPNLTLHVGTENRGLRRSIVEGVSEMVDAFGRAIVVEDDLLLSPIALEYFSASLDAFEGEDNVKAICGYMYNLSLSARGHRAFFLPFASSWGWATWQRAWRPFVDQQTRLTEMGNDKHFRRRLDRQGIIAASTMLKAQREGLIDSWAILWNAYLTLTEGVALFPAESMVLNGGFADRGATHASTRNPINRILLRMNDGRQLAKEFALPGTVGVDVEMQHRLVQSWETRLHRLSALLGYHRRRLARLGRSASVAG